MPPSRRPITLRFTKNDPASVRQAVDDAFASDSAVNDAIWLDVPATARYNDLVAIVKKHGVKVSLSFTLNGDTTWSSLVSRLS